MVLLVVEDDIWNPYELRRHPDGRYIVIIRRTPA